MSIGMIAFFEVLAKSGVGALVAGMAFWLFKNFFGKLQPKNWPNWMGFVWSLLATGGFIFLAWVALDRYAPQVFTIQSGAAESTAAPETSNAAAPFYDPSAFAAVALSTTIDLTKWREVSPEQMKDQTKVSESREHTVWQLRKTQVAAKFFRVTVFTPGLEPDLIPDPKHRLVWHGKVDYDVRPGTNRFDKYVYDFDVSNESVGKVFALDYEMIRWNTHQGKPHWWHGKVIDYPTELLMFAFVFPSSRPSPSNALTLKDYDSVKETHLSEGKDYLVERSSDALTVTFTVRNPKYHFGYLYYFDWQDKPN